MRCASRLAYPLFLLCAVSGDVCAQGNVRPIQYEMVPIDTPRPYLQPQPAGEPVETRSEPSVACRERRRRSYDRSSDPGFMDVDMFVCDCNIMLGSPYNFYHGPLKSEGLRDVVPERLNVQPGMVEEAWLPGGE